MENNFVKNAKFILDSDVIECPYCKTKVLDIYDSLDIVISEILKNDETHFFHACSSCNKIFYVYPVIRFLNIPTKTFGGKKS